jgi:uncharacterized RDD family membrane protein YckC
MTSGPQRGTPGQQWGGGPPDGPADQQHLGTGPQAGAPDQQAAGGPQAGLPDQHGGGGSHGAPPDQQWGSVPQVGRASPVPVHMTRVTPRRIVQYIVDSILVGIIPAIVWFLVGYRGHGVLHAVGWLIAVAVSVLIMIWYWVLRPYSHGGQTFGMQLMSLRIISKDGDRANKTQLVIRWILLIVDSLVFWLVGLITMLFSHYRQRVGDHVAKTLVVRARWQMHQDEGTVAGVAQAPVPDHMQ